tara:strand:- start:787 stop:1233 length:447 start_codon:yes stop_codon:yes gene_type:complete
MVDLSFQEKSAWGSLLAIAVSSGLFYPLAVPHIANGGAFIDILPRLIFVIGVIIVIEIVYHSIIAARSGVESSDERDKEFNLKADRLSGYVLAIGIVLITGHILIRSAIAGAPPVPSSLLVSIYLMLALTVSEASKLVTQIWYYRVNV